MSTESDFASDQPAPKRDSASQPSQRSTRRPAEGTDAGDPAAKPYDRSPADRGQPQERSPRDPADGRPDAGDAPRSGVAGGDDTRSGSAP